MSNAKPILPESIPGLADVIGRTGSYTDFMDFEKVLRCTNHDCNQVLQVGADQMQAFVVVPDGVLCKACELLMIRRIEGVDISDKITVPHVFQGTGQNPEPKNFPKP